MLKKSLKDLLPFLPLLVLYIAVVLIFSTDNLINDEGRHMEYAINLTHGFYSDAENPAIANGPGYPLVMSLFVLFSAPFITIKLLNAILLLLAVVFFFKTIKNYLSRKQAIALSYLFGLYPPFLKWMIYMHSESLAIFLACGFLYYFIKLNTEEPKKGRHIVLSATFLGVLALTKVIFGYVIICCSIFYIIAYFFKRSKKVKHSLLVLTLGFMFCIPFLAYTYSLTGRTFYWGSQGGEILYWRSSPFSDEYGDWISADVVLEKNSHDYFDIDTIYKNHGSFYESLEPYSFVQRDDMFKEKAIEYMGQHPTKYILNTGSSALRLFFNYPYSYTPQKPSTYFYIIPNIFLVVFLLSSSYLAIRKPRAIPSEIRLIALTALIFMGGLTLLDGRVRHLLPIIPLLLFLIVFIHKRTINISWNKHLY